MVDDIQITVGVTGKKDILDLANAVTTLGKNSEKLAKQLESNRVTDAAYEKGIQQQIAALVKLKVSIADAEKFIRGNAAATLKSIEADKASKAAKDALTTSQKRADTAYALAIQKEKEMAAVEKELTASRAKLDATAKQEAATLDQLKMKYQAGYAEMQIYKAENEQLNLAYKKNILTTEQLKVEQDKLNTSFATGTGVFATHANQARSSASRLGVVYQQAGYQAGDFFVQVQSGTSILTAFSQQATQMVGMMYLIPEAGMAAKVSLASLGIAAEITMAQLTLGLSIAIPVITSLASMFMRMSESTDKANESVETSVDVFQRLTEATHQLWIERMKLNDPAFDENLVGTKDKLKELADAYDVATQKVKDLENGFQSLQGKFQAQPAIEAAKQEAIAADIALKAAKEKLDAYQQEVGLAYARERINAQIDAQNEQAIKDLETQQNLQDEFNKKLATAHQIYAKTRLEAAGLAQETANAINALNQMKIEFSPGGQAMMKYGSRSPTPTPEQQALADRNTPKETTGVVGGGTRIAQIKETTVALQAETEANKKLEDSMNMVSSNIADAFMSIVDGSQTVAGAFNNMMYNILKSVYEQSVTQPLANGITGLLKGFLGGGGGGTGSMGLPMPFAKGGVIGSATTFQTSGGRMGLMGEAGPEAIMPLKKGANGQLGVQVNGNNGGNGGSITVNNNINVVGSDAVMVRAEVTKMIPQITEASKSAIIDAKRRGGQMGAAFQ